MEPENPGPGQNRDLRARLIRPAEETAAPAPERLADRTVTKGSAAPGGPFRFARRRDAAGIAPAATPRSGPAKRHAKGMPSTAPGRGPGVPGGAPPAASRVRLAGRCSAR